jgi:TrkA domain protein
VAEVSETNLPGVGARFDVTTGAGDRVSVLVHRSGRREVALYRRDDPDACLAVLHLSPDEASTVGQLLGAPQVTERLVEIQQHVAGLVIDWVEVAPTSPLVGATLRDSAIHSRTGVSIVAIVRDGATVAAPGPDDVVEGGDTLVSVGTGAGIDQLHALAGA